MKSRTARSRIATLDRIEREIIQCRKCRRLVEWRERVAIEKVRRFGSETYWGKPLPGFGDPCARLLIVGLAPAAHGGNRTGRMFTGDRSGDWVYDTLFRHRFANQPTSNNRRDGLQLKDCFITATLRCAPPANKPLPEETRNCRPYLFREFELLTEVRVIVALGKIAFDASIILLSEFAPPSPEKRPRFAHGAEYSWNDRYALIASYHPSQQNTFTGKLTERMFDAIFQRARRLLP